MDTLFTQDFRPAQTSFLYMSPMPAHVHQPERRDASPTESLSEYCWQTNSIK